MGIFGPFGGVVANIIGGSDCFEYIRVLSDA